MNRNEVGRETEFAVERAGRGDERVVERLTSGIRYA
jgi:hypothetical protein